jgi:SAM-dependent methyltransferase
MMHPSLHHALPAHPKKAAQGLRGFDAFCERAVGMRSRFPTIVNEVEAELRRSDRASPYFALLRSGYVDDLMRIAGLHRGGVVLEIGGYPFYFSMCLRKLGVELTTVDLAPQRAQDLIRDYSLRVITCDIEREPLPLSDHSVTTITLCATFEHLRVDPLFALGEMRRVLRPGGLLYLTTPNLYRLGNIASFALGRGLAFDPIREYGKLRSIGHMGHVREYTALEIRRFLESAGFASIEIARRVAPSRRGKLVDSVQRLLPGTRGELVVTARTARDATSGG